MPEKGEFYIFEVGDFQLENILICCCTVADLPDGTSKVLCRLN